MIRPWPSVNSGPCCTRNRSTTQEKGSTRSGGSGFGALPSFWYGDNDDFCNRKPTPPAESSLTMLGPASLEGPVPPEVPPQPKQSGWRSVYPKLGRKKKASQC